MSFISKTLQRLGLLRSEGPEDEPRRDVPEPTEAEEAEVEEAEDDVLGEEVAPTESAHAEEPEATAPLVSTEPQSPPTRRVTLTQLLSESWADEAVPAQEGLARSVGLDASFDDIFRAAGIQAPPHGWTVERARDWIARARAKGMVPAQVRQSLDRALYEADVDVRELAVDAVVRDEALDSYEVHLVAAIQAQRAAIEQEATSARRRIARLEAELAATAEKDAALVEGLAIWQHSKQRAEGRWVEVLEVIAPLLEE